MNESWVVEMVGNATNRGIPYDTESKTKTFRLGVSPDGRIYLSQDD